MIKRLIDVLLSLIMLVILLPILLAIAISVKLQDMGPIFFLQQRVGKGGHMFSIFKFRSMVVNAEVLGGFSTETNDSRITPFGRLIRRTSLDELPQLFNVLMGDMSIVGPRPDVPAQRTLYTEDEWVTRHTVRPGITGLAQSTMRSEATSEQRKAMDLKYIRDVSLALDARIILMTIKQVILKGGN